MDQGLAEPGKTHGSHESATGPSHHPCYEMNRPKGSSPGGLGSEGTPEWSAEKWQPLSAPGHGATPIRDFTRNQRRDEFLTNFSHIHNIKLTIPYPKRCW